MKRKLVVIGNGMAGARLVEEILLRGGGERFEIVMFGDEPYGNYNRILLSNVLAGAHDPKDIFINPLRWYEDNHVKLHAGVRVASVDRAARLVHGDNGVVESYDDLVFAMGSSAFVPRMDGIEKNGVFVFRTLDDCDSIIKYTEGRKTAAVIGGGLLGLEAARGLMERGMKVHVVHLMNHLMEVQLDRMAGSILRSTLVRMGLQVHLEKATCEITGNGSVTGLRFKDGGTLDCDMVVISAGIRPNTQLAKEAGLTVARGIVVGDDLATPDDPNVFAIGECSEHDGKTYGLVAPLWDQARVLAERLSARRPQATYHGSKIATKLKVMGVDLAVMGDRESSGPDDEEVTYAEAKRGVYKKVIVRDGRIVGAILLGDPAAAPGLVQAFDRGVEVPDNRAELLFQLDAGAANTTRIEDLPDDTQICNCNGVSKGDILDAVKKGCRSLKVLCDTTRAGMGCGTCKKQVETLLEFGAGDSKVEDPSVHYYVPGVPLPKPDLVEEIRARGLKSVSAVFRELADGKEDPGSKPGLASLLKTLWGKDYVDERDARFINDRVHANIQRDATFSVIPRIYGGVTTADQLRAIADAADKYDAKMVKITGGQRIDLLGIKKEDLPNVWRDLGMPSGHAYSKAFRTCKTCVGSEFCRYGVGHSTELGIKIEERFQGIESPHKMKLATAGCPRNCSEATTKDIGAVAIEGGLWEIYVGGAAGSRVRKGDILCTVGSQEEVLLYTGRFMQYYRENGKYLERTYDFIERVGIDKVRAVVVDDAEGIAERLDAAMQASVDAYVDPWKETPHETQFSESLEPQGQLVQLRTARAVGER
ncbi:nitrite reductase large subunit NirB [Pendulispora brunnea]|uniref:Nitrite reductase large subunit NirB n=1 Tax=Pendulispora brunnea TaxID=2905690 RepID=A0ABZ2KF73_9BACT